MEKQHRDNFGVVIDETAFNGELDNEENEVSGYEENEEVYKWLSVLLVFIWAVSLVVF